MCIYFVETRTAEQKDLLCRWTERFYLEKKRVRIVVDSAAAGQLIDQALWTFSQSAFIPHACHHGVGAIPEEPVVITLGEFPSAGCNAVICDYAAGLEFMITFEDAVHFILKDDPEATQKSRTLWLAARDSGANLVHVPSGQSMGAVQV